MTVRRKLPSDLPQDFSIRLAIDHGVTRWRLNARDLARPYHGVRSRGTRTTVEERARAYLPLMPAGAAFSHHTAAALWEMPVDPHATVHVTVLQPMNRPRGGGVSGHRAWAPLAVVTRVGLPVTDPVRTWCDLAAVGTDDATLVVLADHLLRRKRPLCSLESLVVAVDRMGRRRGARAASRAFGRARAGTDSPRETRMRLAIVEAGLPEPVVGHEILHDGAFVGTPDLAYPELRIAIEYEGEDHQTNRAIYLADIARREAFERAGWTVVLVTKEHLAGPPDLWIRRIRYARDLALASRVATNGSCASPLSAQLWPLGDRGR